MKYKKREYDSGDKLIYAWQREDMYGCPNDIASLFYDRIVKHCIIPRRPNSLIVDNEYPIGYGFGVAKTRTWLDGDNYILLLSATSNKQVKFAHKVCEALKIDYNDNNMDIMVTIPLRLCDLRIDDYLQDNDLPLELCNRKGFKQYSGGQEEIPEWRRFDLCSLITVT